MSKLIRVPAVALFAAFALVAVGCGDDDDDAAPTITEAPPTSEDSGSSVAPSTTASSATDDTETTSTAAGGGGDGCYVHLFDSDNFDEGDKNFRLTEPGRYSDLDSLPGADDNWTDEADSIRVGPDATVTIWTERDFAGPAQTLEPGSEHPDLDDEPYSLELSC